MTRSDIINIIARLRIWVSSHLCQHLWPSYKKLASATSMFINTEAPKRPKKMLSEHGQWGALCSPHYKSMNSQNDFETTI